MRFLSLSNPWPFVMLHPDPEIRKRIENRSWPPPISEIGKTIALHAAKSWDDTAMRYWIKIGVTDFPMRKELYPSGCIVGVATIDRVRSGDIKHPPHDLEPSQRRWFFGAFGWYLTDAIRIPRPIPMKGGQGLRHLSPEVEADVRAQLAELGRSAA